MDTEERAKWLKWSKLGLRLPLNTEESVSSEQELMHESLEKVLQRQQEMERTFNDYLREFKSGASITVRLKKNLSNRSTDKKKTSGKNITKIERKKWLSF